MVLAIDLRGDPDVGTAPPHGLVAQPPKRSARRSRSRRGAASPHEDVVPDKVQANQHRPRHALVEIAVDGFPDVSTNLVKKLPCVWMPYPSAVAEYPRPPRPRCDNRPRPVFGRTPNLDMRPRDM